MSNSIKAYAPRNILISALFLLTCSIPVNAEMMVKDYEKKKNPEVTAFYLGSVGTGFGWANTYLSTNGKPQMFCVPGNLSLNDKNYTDILDEEIKILSTNSSKVNGKTYRDLPIEYLLLAGLVRTFPCK